MDLTILFTMGLVAGTAFGLVTSRKSRKSRSRSSIKRKSFVKPKRRVDSQKARKSDTKSFVDSQISSFKAYRRTPIGFSRGPGSTIAIQSLSQKAFDGQMMPRTLDQQKVLAFSACPSCGLESSDSLLSEHFLSSPSHRLGRKETVDEKDEKNSLEADKPLTAEEHSSGVMRNLLSMLAPPRAFGRRHMQHNDNPFSELIQRRMQAGASSVPKTPPVRLDN
jgi:hypothetical protein